MLSDARWIVVDRQGEPAQFPDLTAALLYAAKMHSGRLLGPFTLTRASEIMEQIARKLYGNKDD